MHQIAQPSRVDGLDVLRALAVLLILGFHATDVSGWQPGECAWHFGQTGRRLFLLLSAFLLFQPYARAAYRTGPGRGAIDVTAYALKRALRLLPLYVATVLALTLFGYLMRWPANAKNLLYHLLFIHTFDKGTRFGLMGPLWFIALIAHWYMLLPFVGWIWLKLRRPLATWALASLVLAVAYALAWAWPPFSRETFSLLVDRSLVGALPYLFVGMTASAWFARERERAITAHRTLPIALCLAVTGVVIGTLSVFANEGGHHVSPLALGTITLGLAYASPSGRALAPLQAFGRMSYSVYICHSPVFVAVAWLGIFDTVTNGPARTALLFAAALPPLVLASAISYRLLERPFIGLKLASPRRTVAQLGAVYAAVIAASAILFALEKPAAPGKQRPTFVPRREAQEPVKQPHSRPRAAEQGTGWPEATLRRTAVAPTPPHCYDQDS
ncbi:MAG: acyltransferase [Verrucomicrobia bacterium]|nr:acyltransferase [Verrucomicrobiota bacterium]